MAMQHVSVPYPSLDQGTDSFLHLANYALGKETLTKGDLAAHSWIATGYALSRVLPAEALAELPPQVKQQLIQAHEDYAVGKIDWLGLLKLILPLILAFLPAKPPVGA